MPPYTSHIPVPAKSALMDDNSDVKPGIFGISSSISPVYSHTKVDSPIMTVTNLRERSAKKIPTHSQHTAKTTPKDYSTKAQLLKSLLFQLKEKKDGISNQDKDDIELLIEEVTHDSPIPSTKLKKQDNIQSKREDKPQIAFKAPQKVWSAKKVPKIANVSRSSKKPLFTSKPMETSPFDDSYSADRKSTKSSIPSGWNHFDQAISETKPQTKVKTKSKISEKQSSIQQFPTQPDISEPRMPKLGYPLKSAPFPSKHQTGLNIVNIRQQNEDFRLDKVHIPRNQLTADIWLPKSVSSPPFTPLSHLEQIAQSSGPKIDPHQLPYASSHAIPSPPAPISFPPNDKGISTSLPSHLATEEGAMPPHEEIEDDPFLRILSVVPTSFHQEFHDFINNHTKHNVDLAREEWEKASTQSPPRRLDSSATIQFHSPRGPPRELKVEQGSNITTLTVSPTVTSPSLPSHDTHDDISTTGTSNVSRPPPQHTAREVMAAKISSLQELWTVEKEQMEHRVDVLGQKKSDEIRDLSIRITQLGKDRDAIIARVNNIQTLHQQFQNLQDILMKSEQDKKSLQEKLKSSHKKNSEIVFQMKELESSVHSTKESLKVSEEKIVSMRLEKDSLSSRIQELEAIQSQTQAEHSSLSLQIDHLNDANDKLKKEISALKVSIDSKPLTIETSIQTDAFQLPFDPSMSLDEYETLLEKYQTIDEELHLLIEDKRELERDVEEAAEREKVLIERASNAENEALRILRDDEEKRKVRDEEDRKRILIYDKEVEELKKKLEEQDNIIKKVLSSSLQELNEEEEEEGEEEKEGEEEEEGEGKESSIFRSGEKEEIITDRDMSFHSLSLQRAIKKGKKWKDKCCTLSERVQTMEVVLKKLGDELELKDREDDRMKEILQIEQTAREQKNQLLNDRENELLRREQTLLEREKEIDQREEEGEEEKEGEEEEEGEGKESSIFRSGEKEEIITDRDMSFHSLSLQRAIKKGKKWKDKCCTLSERVQTMEVVLKKLGDELELKDREDDRMKEILQIEQTAREQKNQLLNDRENELLRREQTLLEHDEEKRKVRDEEDRKRILIYDKEVEELKKKLEEQDNIIKKVLSSSLQELNEEEEEEEGEEEKEGEEEEEGEGKESSIFRSGEKEEIITDRDMSFHSLSLQRAIKKGKKWKDKCCTLSERVQTMEVVLKKLGDELELKDREDDRMKEILQIEQTAREQKNQLLNDRENELLRREQTLLEREKEIDQREEEIDKMTRDIDMPRWNIGKDDFKEKIEREEGEREEGEREDSMSDLPPLFDDHEPTSQTSQTKSTELYLPITASTHVNSHLSRTSAPLSSSSSPYSSQNRTTPSQKVISPSQQTSTIAQAFMLDPIRTPEPVASVSRPRMAATTMSFPKTTSSRPPAISSTMVPRPPSLSSTSLSSTVQFTGQQPYTSSLASDHNPSVFSSSSSSRMSLGPPSPRSMRSSQHHGKISSEIRGGVVLSGRKGAMARPYIPGDRSMASMGQNRASFKPRARLPRSTHSLDKKPNQKRF
ncbi:hypothetical protein ADUPG1_013234 [Aduncisulcus paluster]|uniref:Uncharacterized protein n=1 Tax=Aduncisulcus paluster TaxID=2918883 RepID=A0ABQ5K280_9EUKA|nr:hypothetical protein ADUPG1_013234 [Aduncisulcus paluster]